MSQPIDHAQIIATAGDAVVVSDVEGAITVWNRAAERIFGFTAEEAIGASLDIITPERHRARHWSGYAKTMETGVTKYGEDVLRVPAIAKDGRQLSIAFTVGMIFDTEQNVVGISAVIRDDTETFAEKKRLKSRISELESRVPKVPAN